MSFHDMVKGTAFLCVPIDILQICFLMGSSIGDMALPALIAKREEAITHDPLELCLLLNV
jgi:hypothetical protein